MDISVDIASVAFSPSIESVGEKQDVKKESPMPVSAEIGMSPHVTDEEQKQFTLYA